MRLNQSLNQSGFLYLGNIGELGAPISSNPTSLCGFYKTSGMQAGDKMSIQSTTRNGNSNKSVATMTITNNAANWTSFSIPFLTITGGMPDTIDIFVTNTPNNTIGSQFDVDNFSFSCSAVGVDENTIGTAFLAYPNPAHDKFCVISKNENARTLVITDLFGKIISESAFENEKASISIDKFPKGIYIYNIQAVDGTVLFTSKLVIE